MKRLLLASTILLGLAGAASADTVLTFGQLGDLVVPQSQSNPCIICATQAQQPPNFGFNNFVSNGQTGSGTFFSTNLVGGTLADGVETGALPYTVGQIETTLGLLANNLTFGVAIDVNSAEGGHPPTIMSLVAFDLFRVDAGLNHIDRLAHINGPIAMPDINPGNGHGDYLLTGFDFTGLNPGDKLIFRAQFTGATDGGDSFYLTAARQVAVPLPIAGAGLPGLLAGLLGLFGLNRYRKNRTA